MGWRDKGEPLGGRYLRRIYRHWLGQHVWVEIGVWRGRKRTWGCHIRRVRTAAEFRAYDPEFCRAKRSPTRLPDIHEEIWRRPQKTWKVHRKTQFKPKEID